MVNPGELFNSCYGSYAIAAVNIWSMEQALALFSAGKKSGSPFIVQTTPAARNYAGQEMLLSMISAADKIFQGNIFSLHLDHGNESHIQEALQSGGYSSVMIDASHDSFEENVRRTAAIVKEAHSRGIFVEAELGVLAGREDDMESLEGKYTKPSEAEEFVRRTGCDSLAIAVGTSHGAYKFSGGAGLQFNILEEISKRLPSYPLVLHGASGVDSREIDRINFSGGKIGAGARGVTAGQIREAIKFGICKVNIATDARLIWTRVHREYFKNNPEQIDSIIPGKTFMEEYEKFLIEKFESLGSAGKNQFIKLSGKQH